MKPSQLVVSLELSKKLQKADVKIDTYFSWTEFLNISSDTPAKCFSLVCDDKEIMQMQVSDFIVDLRVYPAPTAEEVLEELPKYVVKENGDDYTLRVEKWSSGWTVSYEDDKENHLVEIETIFPSLANAAAIMACWLRENKYI